MNSWLVDPPPELLPRNLPRSLPPLPTPAAESEVEAVLPAENGDFLVTLPSELDSLSVYREMGFRKVPPSMMLRRALVERLLRAQGALPAGFDLVILDGWRSVEFQTELLHHYRSVSGSDLEGYVSDPEHSRLMPPHTTGGAVDLTLRFGGRPLALGTDFDVFSKRAHLLSLESKNIGTPEDVLARLLRRLLGHVLSAEGLAPYPLEWWHWSYGEQRWAAQLGRAKTLYSTIE